MKELKVKFCYSGTYGLDKVIIYHLFTETEGNSEFCGPETTVVARSEAEGNNERSRGAQNSLLSRGLSK